MTMSQRWTVIGIFNEQDKAKKAMEELVQAEFTQEQVGFVMRDAPHVISKKAVEEGEESGSFTGGIIGGIVGAAETLLIPVLGPSVANTIPATVEPLAEQVVERFQHTGIDEQQDHILPVTDDGIPEKPVEDDLATDNTAEMAETTETFDPDETIKMAAITSTTNTTDAVVQDEMAAPAEAQHKEEMPADASNVQESEEGEAVPAGISRQHEDEATGAVTGGIVGGVIGVAAGLLLPFIGPAIAGGVLIAALGGAALGAVAGGFMGAFVRMGVPEEQARQYEQEFKAGRTIVTVKTDDRQQDALNILSNNGAIYVNTHDRTL
jgi:outer membrane lipoprotein SlyB